MAEPARPQRIALYGGTFDPVHEGHVAIARAAHQALDLDRVIFLPAFRSPHKTDVDSVSGEHRAAMLRLALAGHEWAELSTWELDQQEPSYSWKTSRHFDAELKKECRPFELFWILGEDQWSALPRWSRPDLLAELLHFIVFPRDGVDPNPRAEFRMTPVALTHPASGTAIRKALKTGRTPEGLDGAVLAYAREQGLYLPSGEIQLEPSQ